MRLASGPRPTMSLVPLRPALPAGLAPTARPGRSRVADLAVPAGVHRADRPGESTGRWGPNPRSPAASALADHPLPGRRSGSTSFSASERIRSRVADYALPADRDLRDLVAHGHHHGLAIADQPGAVTDARQRSAAALPDLHPEVRDAAAGDDEAEVAVLTAIQRAVSADGGDRRWSGSPGRPPA